jgi:hypothetical protein
MNDEQMNLFVGLSVVLTGIDKSKLAPNLDPINIKKTYFDYVQSKADTVFQLLLKIYSQNMNLPPAQIGEIILNQSGESVCNLARSIMLMWYLGSWYEPSDLQKNVPLDPVAVISPTAYTQGWTWSVAQAHPMGYSNFQFGDWSKLPPSLQDFVGGGA